MRFPYGLGLVFLLAAACAPAVFSVSPANPGDLNADNRVDVSDVFMIVNCLGQNAATCQSGRADPNNDGAVNIYDFIAVSRSWGTSYGVTNPGTVTNLQVSSSTTSSITLSFTEATGGAGAPASYDVRFGTPTVNWGTSPSVTSGTCTTPVAGTTIGATKTCTITGLQPNTQYQAQLVAFRGTLNAGAVFGGLSNIATGSTSVGTAAPTVTISANPTSITSGSSTLSWSTTGATSCTASGGWSGTKATSGSQSVSPTSTSTYTLTCTGTGGSGVGSATVTVGSSGGTSTTLLTENFESTGLAARGWYDFSGNPLLSAAEHLPGSASSMQYLFNQGSTTPSATPTIRHAITPTNEVYLSYWIKYSTNWVGSQVSYHPHQFHFITNLDDDYVGPSITHSTFYVEENAGRPILAQQDALNIDQTKVNVNLIGVTENRATAACNGNAADGAAYDCYDYGGPPGYTNSKEWKTATAYFTSAAGANYKSDWHHVEAYFKLNTISGGIGQNNGIAQYWFDGNLIINSQNAMFRTGASPSMLIDQFVIGPYIGVGSPITQSFFVDNLTVATSRPSGGSTTPPTDTTPPTATITAPSANQVFVAGTASVTLSATTNEAATCKYGTSSATQTYANLPGTFGTTGGTSHSTSLSVTNGGSYTYYVRCQDTAGNPMTASQSRSFTVASPGGSSGADGTYTHEPAGYTQQAVNNMNTPESGGWYWDFATEGITMDDSSAITSPSTILRADQSGIKSGDGLFNLQHPLPGGLTEIYYAFTFKLSSSYIGDTSGTNKMGFIWLGNNPSIFWSAEGSGSGPLEATFRLQNVPDTKYPDGIGPNIANGVISRGQWHTWESQVIRNTNGNANGVARWWLDGVLIGEATDVKYASGAVTFPFADVTPIWGGNDGRHAPANQFIDYDQVYVSGK